MAKSPLPLLFAASAFFLLKKKRPEATGTDTPKPDSPPDTSGVPKPGGDAELPAPGDNTTGEPDPVDGSVAVVPAPGIDPIDNQQPGDPAPPVAVDTSGPSGYSVVTMGEMMIIQSRLLQLGYDPGEIDGKWTYNGTTFGAVWDFQTNYGLVIDGKPGTNTQTTLDDVIEGSWVVPGPSPDDVSGPSGYSDLTKGQMKTIQGQLALLGHNPGVIDGKWVYGGNTYNAIREFQTVYDLQVDGRPGPITRNMLDVAADDPTGPTAPVDPAPEILPDPVPANDPNLFVIGTKLTNISGHPDFKKPMLLVEQERSSGIGEPGGFASGYDIYQDQQTLGGDGRFIGVAMAKTNSAESSAWIYRSKPTAEIASADGRVAQLGGQLKKVVDVLKNEMT